MELHNETLSKHHDRSRINVESEEQCFKFQIASTIHEVVHRQVSINEAKVQALTNFSEEFH